MKTKLFALFLLAGTSMFARTHFSIGVGIGVPAYGYYAPAYIAPAPVAVIPPIPGPGYTWVAGYWYPAGPRRYWVAGHWAPPVYGLRSRVVFSRPYGRGYYNGFRGSRGYYR